MDAILFLDVRALVQSMWRRLRAWRRYRLAAYNLRHSFPDATPAQLAANPEGCAICKDTMQVLSVLANGSAAVSTRPRTADPLCKVAYCEGTLVVKENDSRDKTFERLSWVVRQSCRTLSLFMFHEDWEQQLPRLLQRPPCFLTTLMALSSAYK